MYAAKAASTAVNSHDPAQGMTFTRVLFLCCRYPIGLETNEFDTRKISPKPRKKRICTLQKRQLRWPGILA